jgi:DNA-binding NarL/FixJ family response regulator
MKVAIVGGQEARAQLRAELTAASIEVVAEYPTLAQARAADIDVDGFVLAPDTRGVRQRSVRLQPDRNLQPDPLRADDVFAEPLTPRELEVLELLAEGLPNKAIAVRLGISDQTVKFHVGSISGKLGASNRTDAVRRAVRRGLLTL